MNRVQRATLVAAAGERTPEDLGLVPGAAAGGPPVLDHGQGAERRALEQILLRDGRQRVPGGRAAWALSRQALYRRMEKLGHQPGAAAARLRRCSLRARIALSLAPRRPP